MVQRLEISRGLLGGASKDGKVSKLAALAAKRRQKEMTQVAEPTPSSSSDQNPQDEYAASLSKLTLGAGKPRYRKRQIKDEDESALSDGLSVANTGNELAENEQSSINPEDEPIVERTRASAFAGTLLDNEDSSAGYAFDSALIPKDKPSFDFTGPSPDDIVFKSQTGRTR